MDNKEFVTVTSASDYTLVINVPEIPLHRTWAQRGASYPIKRSDLEQAVFNPSVKYLFEQGLLTTKDIDFLGVAGLTDENNKPTVIVLTEDYMVRLIKNMPLAEFKQEIAKLARTQLEELADFAIVNYDKVSLDRIDLLAKATGKDILKSIENYKKSQEA